MKLRPGLLKRFANLSKRLWVKLIQILDLQQIKGVWRLGLNVSQRCAANEEALGADLCPVEGERAGVGRDVLPLEHSPL